jgi:sugar phosphate isomerase/epimerase
MSSQTADPAREAKLKRVAILTLNFQSVLKGPTRPDGTLDLMDIPDMFADRFGVHYVEVFCSHFLSTEHSYFKAFSDRLKKAKSKVNQISLGGLSIVNMSSPDPVVRLETIDLSKQWIDHAVELECPRVMVDQGPMPLEWLDEVIKTLKAISDYGKSKKVFVTLEPRGVTKADLVDVIKAAGAYSNADMGNYPDDETRHREMRRMYPMDTGSTHIKYAPERWNFEEAIKLWQSLGFKGIFALEGSGPDPYATTQRMLDALLPLI